jgi:hypothetical protein
MKQLAQLDRCEIELRHVVALEEGRVRILDFLAGSHGHLLELGIEAREDGMERIANFRSCTAKEGLLVLLNALEKDVPGPQTRSLAWPGRQQRCGMRRRLTSLDGSLVIGLCKQHLDARLDNARCFSGDANERQPTDRKTAHFCASAIQASACWKN